MDFANLKYQALLIILFPIYKGLRSNIRQSIALKVLGPEKLKNCSARPMITFVLQGRQKKAALTEHQKCTKLLVEMTSSMMHIFVFLQKIWVIQTRIWILFSYLNLFDVLLSEYVQIMYSKLFSTHLIHDLFCI